MTRRSSAPACVIRGEWDGLAIDADSCWLFDAFASPNWRDLKIGRGRT